MPTTTIAYQYGLLNPINWDDDCREHLFLMNRLWNTLVEIDRKHRARYREIIGSDDAVAPLQQRLDQLKERQAELRNKRKAQRQAARARVATPGIDDELRSLATQIQDLSQQIKAAKAEAKARVKPLLYSLSSEHFEAVKAARQPERSGLYWGNYNAVVASYEAARSRAMKDGGELRFRRFTGEGRFTVQIVNGASVDEITSGKKQVSIDLREQPVPGRSGKPRPRLSITVYTKDREPRLLTFPLIYDRPLPENCRVQQVVVTRRRIGTKWRYAAVFTCRIERPNVSSINKERCGINLGFRQMQDGGLRVATIYSCHGVEHLELPKDWLDGIEEVETLRQRRDQAAQPDPCRAQSALA